MPNTITKKIGVVAVDAGLIWLGDPCYILHKENKLDEPKDIGRTWGEFCDKLHTGKEVATQFNFDLGHEGLGVCVDSGYGDGCYDVMAEIEGGRVKKVWINFF